MTLKTAILTFIFAYVMGANAMEPGVAISPADVDYNYYSQLLEQNQNHVKSGLVLGGVAEWTVFNTVGSIAAINDGSYDYPYNVVLRVNGNLYYVDTILSTVMPDENGVMFKIRRRWNNNPEPGVFIRIAGTRFNPIQSIYEYTQIWIKIADTKGNSIPVLRVTEGNWDE